MKLVLAITPRLHLTKPTVNRFIWDMIIFCPFFPWKYLVNISLVVLSLVRSLIPLDRKPLIPQWLTKIREVVPIALLTLMKHVTLTYLELLLLPLSTMREKNGRTFHEPIPMIITPPRKCLAKNTPWILLPRTRKASTRYGRIVSVRTRF